MHLPSTTPPAHNSKCWGNKSITKLPHTHLSLAAPTVPILVAPLTAAFSIIPPALSTRVPIPVPVPFSFSIPSPVLLPVPPAAVTSVAAVSTATALVSAAVAIFIASRHRLPKLSVLSPLLISAACCDISPLPSRAAAVLLLCVLCASLSSGGSRGVS